MADFTPLKAPLEPQLPCAQFGPAQSGPLHPSVHGLYPSQTSFRVAFHLPTRSLLSLLEECNPDASNDRAAYVNHLPMSDFGSAAACLQIGPCVDHCKGENLRASETDNEQIEKCITILRRRDSTTT